MTATALDSSVTLDEVFTVVATKRVPLAPELAGYLVLELAEHADPSGGDIDPKSVFVGEEGTVALVKPKREGACGDPEASIRAALARLLDASGSQTPALAVASKRKSGSGLVALAEELEAALIPVNRSAARRALARLAREVKRVTLGVGRAALQSSSDAGPSSRRSSAAFYTPAPPSVGVPPTAAEAEPPTARTAVPDEVLRQATPQPPASAEPGEAPTAQVESEKEPPTVEFRPSDVSPSQADVDALIATFAVSEGGESRHTNELKAIAGLEPTPPPPPGRAERPPTLAAAQGRTARVDPRQLPTQPTKLRQRASLPSVPSAKSGRATRTTAVFVLLAVVALAAGPFAVWRLRPSAAVSPTQERPEPIAPLAAAAPATCRGTLIVSDVPARAEVLIRQGQAPVDVERMPVGSRLEFVATAEGFSPKRVIVPAEAVWDATPEGKPRLETAVQLDKSHVRPGMNDPWPASEPGSSAGGKGAPGTVHVVATPRGAEIWLLAGLGPEARVDLVSCNEDLDVLLAGPGTYRKRLHVVPSDFVLESPSSQTPTSPGSRSSPVARVSGK
jgi:hypothetical protein